MSRTGCPHPTPRFFQWNRTHHGSLTRELGRGFQLRMDHTLFHKWLIKLIIIRWTVAVIRTVFKYFFTTSSFLVDWLLFIYNRMKIGERVGGVKCVCVCVRSKCQNLWWTRSLVKIKIGIHHVTLRLSKFCLHPNWKKSDIRGIEMSH